MNKVSVCRCYLERYQHFVRMAKRSCILIIMIVLVETSMTITRRARWPRELDETACVIMKVAINHDPT